MPSFKKLFPSKYIKSADLDGEELEVTIRSLELEYVGTGNDAEEKPVLRFEDLSQGLCLNVTNANSIGELYGDDYVQWSGKRIRLYPTTTQMGGKTVDCVRIKGPKKTATVPDSDDDGGGDLPF